MTRVQVTEGMPVRGSHSASSDDYSSFFLVSLCVLSWVSGP